MRIQVGHIFKQSFQNVWRHKLEWCRVAFAPFIVWVFGILFMSLIFVAIGYPLTVHQALLGQISPIIIDQVPPVKILILGGFAKLAYEAAYWFALISLAINGFRYGVLQEGGNGWWALHLNKRFWKMLGYMFLVILFLGVCGAIGGGVIAAVHYFFTSLALDIVLGALLALCVCYILLRISLYQVLIAIDKTHPIRTSWHLLKGNILRLIGLFFLLSLTFGGIFLGGILTSSLLGALLAFISPVLMESASVLIVLLGVCVYFASWAVFSKALALVYQLLKQDKAA